MTGTGRSAAPARGGALGLARLELRRVVLGLPGLVTVGVLVVAVLSAGGGLSAELARDEGAVRVARGLERQALWASALSVISLLTVLHAAGTVQRWREGVGEGRGSRPGGRGAGLGCVWLGQLGGAAILLLLTLVAVRLGSPPDTETFQLARASTPVEPRVVDPGESVLLGLDSPTWEGARAGEVSVHLLASWTARASGDADSGAHAADHAHAHDAPDQHAGHRHLELDEAQAAVAPEGSSARSGWARAVVRRQGREASTERAVEGRTRLHVALPAGEAGLAELELTNTGDAPWILLGEHGIEVWLPAARESAADARLWWRATWTLAPLLALGLLFAPWMSVGSALGSVAALALLSFMVGAGALQWLPGHALLEALRVTGLGRVPGAASAAEPAAAALIAAAALTGAAAGLRSWRHAR